MDIHKWYTLEYNECLSPKVMRTDEPGNITENMVGPYMIMPEQPARYILYTMLTKERDRRDAL